MHTFQKQPVRTEGSVKKVVSLSRFTLILGKEYGNEVVARTELSQLAKVIFSKFVVLTIEDLCAFQALYRAGAAAVINEKSQNAICQLLTKSEGVLVLGETSVNFEKYLMELSCVGKMVVMLKTCVPNSSVMHNYQTCGITFYSDCLEKITEKVSCRVLRVCHPLGGCKESFVVNKPPKKEAKQKKEKQFESMGCCEDPFDNFDECIKTTNSKRSITLEGTDKTKPRKRDTRNAEDATVITIAKDAYTKELAQYALKWKNSNRAKHVIIMPSQNLKEHLDDANTVLHFGKMDPSYLEHLSAWMSDSTNVYVVHANKPDIVIGQHIDQKPLIFARNLDKSFTSQ